MDILFMSSSPQSTGEAGVDSCGINHKWNF